MRQALRQAWAWAGGRVIGHFLFRREGAQTARERRLHREHHHSPKLCAIACPPHSASLPRPLSRHSQLLRPSSSPQRSASIRPNAMADPQETWRNLQRRLVQAQQQGRRFGGGGGGPPKGAFAGLGLLLTIGGAAVVINNALFNGACPNPLSPVVAFIMKLTIVSSRRRSPRNQVHQARRRGQGYLQ